MISGNRDYAINARDSVIQGNAIGYYSTGNPENPFRNDGFINGNNANDVRVGYSSQLPGPELVLDNRIAGILELQGNATVQGNDVGEVSVFAPGALIGGSSSVDSNVIVQSVDIFTQGQAIVQGNFIGVDRTGSPLELIVDGVQQGFGIGRVSMQLGASGNVIGTDGDGAADDREGNLIRYVRIVDAETSDNRVSGNLIGTDLAGTSAFLNGGWVRIDQGASDNLIGTDGDGVSDEWEGNVIAGYLGERPEFPAAVYIHGSSNAIAGNAIGTDRTGTVDLANSAYGILIRSLHSAANDNRIGANGDGVSEELEGNIIAFNYLDGIATFGETNGHSIRGNRIYSNGELGIDHDRNGVTPNDTDTLLSGGPDGKTRNRQNFPVLNAAGAGAETRVVGSLNSLPNTRFLIDFYANETADPSGYGEGQRWLGFVDVVSDANGDVYFNATLPASTAAGQFITATATRFEDQDGDPTTARVPGETSEFSAAIEATDVDPAVIVVTNTSAYRAGSLREAILQANAMPGENTIVFDIPPNEPGASDTNNDGTPDVYVIQPVSLPAINDATGGTTIDGRTQPGYSAGGDTTIVIDGGDLASTSLLEIQSDNNTIVGLNLRNSYSYGIYLSQADGNWITGNRIGTDETGTVAMPNSQGVVLDNAKNNVIGTNGDGVNDENEGNLISGNVVGVFLIANGSDDNVVAGNFIGVDVTGTTALGNDRGVEFFDPSPQSRGANRNLFGTNGDGISDSAERNIISGNHSSGITLASTANTTSRDNVIAGNYMGVDVSGARAVPNGGPGVDINLYATGTLIGTDGDGVADDAESNLISRNLGAGVVVFGPDTKIVGNTITRNGSEGVLGFTQVNGVPRNLTVRANSIDANGALGLDLIQTGFEGDGVTPNDAGDLDDAQNFPVLSQVVTGESTRITGNLDSIASTRFVIDLYANDAADPSGHGEGQTPLDSFEVETNTWGIAVFDANLSLDPALTVGKFITATATRLEDRDGDPTTPPVPVGTSEFSRAVENAEAASPKDAAEGVGCTPETMRRQYDRPNKRVIAK